MRAVSPLIVVRDPLLEMVASANELSQPETGNAHSIVRLYHEHAVLYAPGDDKKLLRQLAGDL
jgi:hypothetical protein